MSALCTRIESVLADIATAAADAGRLRDSVTLLAVSKTHPVDLIRAAYNCGLRCFGENYVQEAIEKIVALKACDIEWHFIGPLQANKTRAIAESFSWVHGVDREKIARRLNDQRPEHLPPINICLQVNVSGESTKSGVSIGELPDLARAVVEMPHLRLRGLMAIGAPNLNDEQQLTQFERVRVALADLNAEGCMCDTLSMGMSGDFHAAIAKGATIVRVGQAVFGPRTNKFNAA